MSPGGITDETVRVRLARGEVVLALEVVRDHGLRFLEEQE